LQKKQKKEGEQRLPLVKQVLFCLVILFLFFGSVEAVFRIFDWFNPYLAEDPFAGFERSLIPGFIEAEDDTMFLCRNPDLQNLPNNRFPLQVDPGTLRAAILGGSNVVNLEIDLLESAIADSTGYAVSIVNAGVNSYGSQRLAPLAEEVLDIFDIDLLILYTGHNEFQERRFYRHLIEESPIIREIRIRLWHLHLYTSIRTAVREVRLRTVGFEEKEPWAVPGRRSVLPEKPELAGMHGNWEESLMTYRHFRFNLQKIGKLAGRRGIPLLVVLPVSNDQYLSWSPCFHETWTPEEIEELDRRWEEGWSLYSYYGQTNGAIEVLENLEDEFGPHSGIELGLHRLFNAIGDSVTAVTWLRKSYDNDCSPSMANDRIAGILRDFAETEGHRLLDARTKFRGLSRLGIITREFMADHCHLNRKGRGILFEMIAKEVADMLETGALLIGEADRSPAAQHGDD